MIETTGVSAAKARQVITAEELMEAQALVRRIPVGDRVVDSILRVVRAARPQSAPNEEIAQMIAWGPGPRASQALMLAVRVRAILQGRLAPSVEDVLALAAPVLRHRMALTFTARAEGVTLDSLIERLCRMVD
jgi:MoxR-like ATPase